MVFLDSACLSRHRLTADSSCSFSGLDGRIEAVSATCSSCRSWIQHLTLRERSRCRFSSLSLNKLSAKSHDEAANEYLPSSNCAADKFECGAALVGSSSAAFSYNSMARAFISQPRPSMLYGKRHQAYLPLAFRLYTDRCLHS